MAIYVLIRQAFLLFFVLGMYSCAQEIDIDLPEQPAQLIIDGWVEPGQQVRVLLTASVNFTEPIDSGSYLNIVMTRAKVSVIEDGVEEVLTLRRDTSYFPPHIYTSNRMRGKVGSEYTIIAEYNGQIVSGTSTILEPPVIDTAYFALDEGEDSLGFIWVNILDQKQERNFYRVRTMVQQKDQRYIGAQISAYNDGLFPQDTISVPIYRGMKNISDKLNEHRFRVGDTVSICVSSMGEQENYYWTSFDRAILNTGNPFTTGGTNLPSNMSNGLGIWTAYGSTYITVVCK